MAAFYLAITFIVTSRHSPYFENFTLNTRGKDQESIEITFYIELICAKLIMLCMLLQ